MASCGADKDAGRVVMISLEDGSLVWSSDRVTHPYGLVHHPAGYILVSSGGRRDHVVISVLEEVNGMLHDMINHKTLYME